MKTHRYQDRANQEAFLYYLRLQRVKDYVESHLADDLSLKAVSRVAGFEQTYFSSFFHAKVGLRFSEWVSALRVERAKELLAEQNRSITSVAFAVGFHDIRTFQRAFRKFTQLTPREYKRSVRPS